VPETSRSFHYWQSVPRWRLLPWLENPGNPAMSPHMEGEKMGTSHTDKTVEREGGKSPHSGKMLMLRKNAD